MPEACLLYAAVVYEGTRLMRIPGGGAVSSFPFLALVASAHPEIGAWIALASVCTAGLFALPKETAQRVPLFSATIISISLSSFVHFLITREQLRDIAPVGSGLASYLIGGIAFILLLELGLGRSTDPLLGRQSRRELRPLLVFCLGAGAFCLGLLLSPLNRVYILAYLPVFWLCDRVIENLIFRLESEQAQKAIEEKAAREREVRGMQRNLDQAGRENLLMSKVSEALSSVSDEQDGVQALLGAGASLFKNQRVVFFLSEGQDGKRWLGLSRPSCPKDVRKVLSSLADSSLQNAQLVHKRLAKPCLIGLAAPVGEFGVLTLSRDTRAYSENEVALFESLCHHGHQVFQTARERATELQHRLALMSQVEVLQSLNVTSHNLMSELSYDGLMRAFSDGINDLLHSNCGILAYRDKTFHWGNGLVVQQTKKGVVDSRSLLEDAARNHRSNTLEPEWLSASGIESQSGLYLEILGDGTPQLQLLLASAEPCAFQPVHEELLGTLSAQLVSSLVRLDKILSLENALTQLKEKQNQLIQSSKMTALGTMVAGLAHEINNPLSAVALSIESATLQVGKRPEYAEQKLDLALEAVTRIQNIVDHLLLFSHRNDLVGNDSARGLQSHGDILRELRALTSSHLSQRQLALECSCDDEALQSPRETVQILVNLVLNAGDAVRQRYPAEEKRPTIVVVAGRCEQDEFTAFFSVEDRGIGMSSDVRSRMFEPFFTTKEVGKGTGLGLSIVHEIADFLGAVLEVESEVGRGTKVVVKLR